MSILASPGFLCGLLSLLLHVHTHSPSYIVTTKSGDVKGMKVTVGDVEVYTYLGIPYAVPPVGELRFKTPKPVHPWKGVRDATKFSPLCWQHIADPLLEWYPIGNQNFSEDCLSLNIWVPARGKDYGKMAVMVWIHGGAFFSGSSALDIYDGKNLAVHGNVIVVSLNYRLDAFGFLCSGTDDAPGNMAFMDQVLALQWIKDNIMAFGGDPTQITVFGESAGSVSISSHLVSPLAQGLFERAILQSGTAYHPTVLWNISQGIAKANMFAHVVGCAEGNQTMSSNPSSMVKCLRKLNASEIAIAARKMLGPENTFFYPVYGDEYLPRQPLEEMKAGKIQDVPILIGNLADEGSFFLGINFPPLFEVEYPVITKSQAAAYIKALHPSSSANATINYYLRNVSDNDSRLILKRVYDSIGDYIIRCPGVFLSEAFSTYGLKARYYVFNHRRLITPYRAWLGVPHFEDIPFLFGTHFVQEPWLAAVDKAFSKKIMEVWTSFAKTGKPSSEQFGIDDWPLYEKENPTAIELNPYKSTLTNPFVQACHFWKKYF